MISDNVKLSDLVRTDAEIFLMRDVVAYWNEDCKKFVTGDDTIYSSYALGYTFLVWFVVFLCIFKGVKGSSYVVWFTVPGPVLFILVMIIKNATLPESSTGVDWYLNGRDDPERTYDNVIPDAVG